ncbi:MAG: hypothetical protein DMG29_07340 [Acidobacteria bacterium]|nr:MAG: hypothetical protein DMG29_07340 [Acidobacteriota bacterium]
MRGQRTGKHVSDRTLGRSASWQSHLDEFTDLLRDAAESGASIGFLPPLDDTAIFYREIHL